MAQRSFLNYTNLIVLLTFTILCCLGIWQLNRLNWKSNIIKEINYKIDLPSVDFPASIDDVQDLKYRLVRVKGHYLHDKEIHLYGGSRTIKGEPGYFILTPIELDNGSTVLVNRGWVPQNLKNPKERPQSLVTGEVEVEGYFLEGEKKTWTTLDNDVEKNIWLWIDLIRIREYLGINLSEGIVVRKKSATKEYPEGKDILTAHIRNDHLAYSITWFGAAVSLLVIYFIRATEKKNS